MDEVASQSDDHILDIEMDEVASQSDDHILDILA